MQDRGHNVILEYVPVWYDPSDRQAQHAVEELNSLPNWEILAACWLKNVEKCHPGQQTTFVLMTIQTAQHANSIIHGGIIVEGKCVFGHKSFQEVKKCLKCQGYCASH